MFDNLKNNPILIGATGIGVFFLFTLYLINLTPFVSIDQSLNPVTLDDGTQAVVLDVPYFNQYLNEAGEISPKTETGGLGKPAGSVMCGAASAVMINGFLGNLPFSDSDDLKEYTYTNKDKELPSICANYGINGAFGMTALGSNCQYNTIAGIQNYFLQYEVQTTWTKNVQFDQIKESIDNSKPVLMVFCTFSEACHMAVITGYSEKQDLIVNDPWRDLSVTGGSYTHEGEDAIYPFDLASSIGNYTGVLYLD